MPALNTDFYELTMAAGYWLAGKTEEIATFELSIRRLPPTRNFLLAAGLQQALEYLRELRFEPAEIEYLRSQKPFQKLDPAFFEYLAKLRFTGDLYAVPEGTPVFANEPIALIRAPLVEAQLVETYLLSTFAFQTNIAAKAARCAIAAEGRPVVEFGSRRAHGPEAGVLAGHAAFLGGCSGTSNAEAGRRFGVPLFGTAAHSWTMSFDEEEPSFRALQNLLGDATVFLIDTYDTLEGAHLAAQLGRPVWGVRLDSGNIAQLAGEVRDILDKAGLQHAKIFATNDLDEHRIAEIVRSGAPVDAFGVGTQLATAADAPALSAVYKLVELRRGDTVHYTAKFSDEKMTRPGAKQVYRFPDHDIVALQTECNSDYGAAPLLRPVLFGGELVEPLPSLAEIRARADENVAALPSSLRTLDAAPEYPVEFSRPLEQLTETLREEHRLSRQ